MIYLLLKKVIFFPSNKILKNDKIFPSYKEKHIQAKKKIEIKQLNL